MTLLSLTTLADVRALMQETQPTAVMDAVIESMILAVSARLEQELNRGVMLEERVEVLSPEPYAQLLVLRAMPIDPDADFEVIEDLSRVFTDVDPIEASAYYVDRDAALVHLDGQLSGKKGSVQVTYTGGLAADTATLKADFPAIWQAATFWVKELYDNRNQLGRSGESVAGTSVSWTEGLGDVPDVVRSLIGPWVRPVISG